MTTTLVILLLSLLALLLLSLLAYAAGRAGRRKAAPRNSGGAAGSARSDAGGTDSVAPRQRPEGCCGQHAVCEKDSLFAAVSRDVEYFDDEELDAFSGRQSDSYTDDEAELFSDVLYTMRQDEVAAWCRSLHLRGIELPDQIKDEVYMLRTN